MKKLLDLAQDSSFLLKYHLTMAGAILFALIIGLPVFVYKIMLIVLFIDNLALMGVHRSKALKSKVVEKVKELVD